MTAMGSFSLPPDHPCLPGHFPGHPLVPGALLLDHALALIATGMPLPQGPITVKFLLPVSAGDAVEIHCEPSRLGGLIFEGRSGPRLFFTGRVSPPP